MKHLFNWFYLLATAAFTWGIMTVSLELLMETYGGDMLLATSRLQSPSGQNTVILNEIYSNRDNLPYWRFELLTKDTSNPRTLLDRCFFQKGFALEKWTDETHFNVRVVYPRLGSIAGRPDLMPEVMSVDIANPDLPCDVDH